MDISFEGIGAWSATFLSDGAAEGQVVKLSAAHTVKNCAAGDAFCGVCGPVRQGVCAVQLGGLACVPYSGETAPAVGMTALAADGSGGVCAAKTGGAAYLVTDVDEDRGVCVIKL